MAGCRVYGLCTTQGNTPARGWLLTVLVTAAAVGGPVEAQQTSLQTAETGLNRAGAVTVQIRAAPPLTCQALYQAATALLARKAPLTSASSSSAAALC
jgi:hypothetical protein